MADQKDDQDIRASWVSETAGAHDQTLVENWLIRLRRERFRSRKSGKTHDFFVAYLNDGVHVVAVTPENEVVMVRQFRVGLHRDSLETPGGLLEPGEDPCVAGARELLEETGYAGDSPMLLGTISPNPGFLAQRIATIVICNARRIAEPGARSDRRIDRRARSSPDDPLTHQARRHRTRSLSRRPSLVACPIRSRSRRALITAHGAYSTRSGSRLAVWAPAISHDRRASTANAVPA